jgi:arginine exporter protein ArgO
MRIQRVFGVLIVIPYLVFAGARMFESTVYGIDPRRPYAVVTFVGILFALVFGPGLWRDAMKRDTEQKRREIEFEKSQVRDPIAETQFRRDIGMTSDEPNERGRDS